MVQNERTNNNNNIYGSNRCHFQKDTRSIESNRSVEKEDGRLNTPRLFCTRRFTNYFTGIFLISTNHLDLVILIL